MQEKILGKTNFLALVATITRRAHRARVSRMSRWRQNMV